MPFAFVLFLSFQPLHSFMPIPIFFSLLVRPLFPTEPGTHRPRVSRNPTFGQIWESRLFPTSPHFFPSTPGKPEEDGSRAGGRPVTSAAALEAQGAGEGAHGGVEGVAHRRGLAGGGVRLAAVAVGLAGLLVHPQGRQRQLLPMGREVASGTARHSAGAEQWGGHTDTPYLFSRRPLPVSRKPLANGLLSIFSWVICWGETEKKGGVKPLPSSPQLAAVGEHGVRCTGCETHRGSALTHRMLY